MCLRNGNVRSTNILEFNSITIFYFKGGENFAGHISHNWYGLECPPATIGINHTGKCNDFCVRKRYLIPRIIAFSLADILKQRDDTDFCFFPDLVDNLWSAYSEKGSIVEKKDQPSVAGSEESKMGGLPYVFTDIMTYFTMLVGIYFPSVTGRYNYFSCVRMCTYIWKKKFHVKIFHFQQSYW